MSLTLLLKGGSECDGLGNTVFLVTKVPRTMEELELFLPSGQQKIGHRDMSNLLFSKVKGIPFIIFILKLMIL